MASYTPFLEYAASPDIDTDTTLISSFSDNRIISSFVIANSGSSSASVEMYLADSVGNKLASILSGYSVGTGRSQTLDVNSLNLPATYQIIVNSDGADVDFIASGVRISATYTGDAESVIEEYTEAAKALIDLYVEDVSKPSIDDYVENTSKPEIDAYVNDALGEAVENAEASATAAAISETNAATSESNASDSETAAATSESNAAASETAAETAATNAETYYNNIDSNVASAIASVHTETPSLSIPFNESGRLDYGVGTEYVSGLPVYGVDFTRSTSCYYVNKSGLIDYADVDEIAIGSDGVYLHNSLLGGITYSSDISNSDWGKNNATVVDDGTEPPIIDGVSGLSAYHLVNDATSDYHRIVQIPTGNIGWVTGVAIVKPDEGFKSIKMDIRGGAGGEAYKIVVFNADTKTFTSVQNNPDDYGYYELNDGWFLIYLNFYDDTGRSGCQCYLSFLPTGTIANIYTGDGVNGGYVAYFQRVESDGVIDPRLLCVTGSTTATITATNCPVPVQGNLPATGYPFTLSLDTSVIDTSESGRELITVADQTSTTCFEGISLESGGDVTFSSGTDGQGDVSLGGIFDNTAYVDGGNNRITFAYDEDAETVTCYVNGTANSTGAVSVSGMTLPYDGNLELGNNLNAQIKNVNLYAYTASADEIASWGAPK